MQNTEITVPSRLTMRTFVLQWAPAVVAAGLLWAATAAGRIPIPGTPVPITLQTLVVMMAGVVSVIIPSMIIFIVGQKQLIRGMFSGAVKG